MQPFDDFEDDCLRTNVWSRLPHQTPAPQIATGQNCVQYWDPQRKSVILESRGNLRFSASSDWEDGVLPLVPAGCAFDSVLLRGTVSDLTGRAWIGLTVDDPQRSPEVLSLWLGRIGSWGEPIQVAFTDQITPAVGSLARQTLQADIQLPMDFEFSATFSGSHATLRTAVNGEVHEVSQIAADFPTNFIIRYWAGTSSTLSAQFPAVYASWIGQNCSLSIHR